MSHEKRGVIYVNRAFIPDYDQLRIDFDAQAEFRREKAVEYPTDTRNAEAAEIFDKLSKSAGAVPASLMEAYIELFENATDGEAHQSMLKEVGFHWWPEDATEFVKAYIAKMTGG
jgi:hypothetical protein